MVIIRRVISTNDNFRTVRYFISRMYQLFLGDRSVEGISTSSPAKYAITLLSRA
ncbi:hypothetical protein [Tolypothrix sp. PCC 7910]|uniref:hypothetical protein n=1 Tax=Tolypothrix sp. PCC 7910 TaxID=2099387 RepID=UPI00142FBF72|nr:hypothetical protein [Tolypothrix sp. PCC 7910]